MTIRALPASTDNALRDYLDEAFTAALLSEAQMREALERAHAMALAGDLAAAARQMLIVAGATRDAAAAASVATNALRPFAGAAS